PSAESNRHSEPCRRRAFVHDACTVQFPSADPAAAYRSRSAQLISVFGIGVNTALVARQAHHFAGIFNVAMAMAGTRSSCRLSNTQTNRSIRGLPNRSVPNHH